MALTEEQKEYAQRVAIASLIGGLGGGLIGQFASKPATMGKTVLGVVLGAGAVGAGYGLYLRSGGEEGAEFAGVGQWGWRQSRRRRRGLGQWMRPRRFPGNRPRHAPLRECVGGVMTYPHMRTTMGRLASCASCGPTSGYEVERRKTIGRIKAFRGTYEVGPGSCAEF